MKMTGKRAGGVKRRIALAISLALCAGGFALPATADTEQRRTANGCQAAYGHQASKLTHSGRGQVTNSSNQGVYVVCPITRAKSNQPWLFWAVTVNDQHPSRDVSCTFQSVHNGTVMESTVRRSTRLGTSALTKGNRECGTFSCSTGPTNTNARYAMRCYLPGRAPNGRASQINSYMLNERG